MKILFISHDANRAGAQLFLLNIMKYLQKKGFSMHLLLLNDGILKKEFEEICKTSMFQNGENENKQVNFTKKNIIKLFGKPSKTENPYTILKNKLINENFDLIYANTIATAPILPEILEYLKIPLYTHIHELEFSIKLYSKKKESDFLFNNSTKIIACSNAVAENIIRKHNFPVENIEIIHSFVENDSVIKRSQNTDMQAIKKKYSIPEKSFLIGGCGNSEWRKGVDIFVHLANRIISKNYANFHFVWIGMRKEGEFYEQNIYEIEKFGIEKYFTFIEPTPDAIELITCLDIFTLVSREDPFPLVMLEAALAEKTIIGFENTGGCSEFIEEDAGIIVKYSNIVEMANVIFELHENQDFAKKLGQNAKNKVLTKYSFENSVIKIEKLLTSASLS